MIKLIKENDYSETDEFTLVKKLSGIIRTLNMAYVDNKKFEKRMADYFYYDEGSHQEDFKELEDIVKQAVKVLDRLGKLKKRIYTKQKESGYKMQESKNYDEEFMMIVKISSSLNADGCDIQISDGEDIVYEKSYRYGYDASYDRGFANKDKPYIADIITDLCKKYHINKKNIVFENGFNVFYGTKNGVSDKEVKDFIKKYIFESSRVKESHKRLSEQDTKIEVKHEGILEVPEGKNVDDLPMSHFEKLVKKNGLSKITKALNNLQVWNKNDDKKLSKWAGDMIDKLTKKYGKNESLKEDNTYKSYWKYDVESDVFNRNEDSDTYLTKYDIRKVKLIPCKTPEECYDDERYWAVCNYEYPYDEFYGTKQEAYDMLLTSWNNSKYERIHDI